MKKIFFIPAICSILAWIYIFSLLESVWDIPRPDYGHIILSDISGNILTHKWLAWGYMIPYTWSIDEPLFDAIMQIEDKRFREHFGIDYRAKIAGIRENIKAGKVVRWSSTITEQYIKNMYFRGYKRTIRQKLDEAIIALWIETRFSKEEILRKYLDNIYFGNRIYGLQGAIDVYFPWKTLKDLTEDDILEIIVRIRTPNIGTTDIAWKQYKIEVAKRLGWEIKNIWELSIKERQNIELYPLITQRVVEAKKQYCNRKTDELKKWTYTIPEDICSSQSTALNITILRDLQEYSSTIIQKTLSRIEKENVTGSAVYIYHPIDQKIRAYVGNRWVSSTDGDIDMITRRRSVGSTLKPFIYLLALREWAEIESLILDDTRSYPTGIREKLFVPQNYNPRTYGPTRLREALWNSLNSSTVRLSEAIGVGRIYDFFKSIGLSLNHDAGYYGYGISLGTVELSLQNIVESYSLLIDMQDPNIFLIWQTLSDPKNRAKTFGISSILNSSINLPVKTGTSTDFRDNWVVSYHKDAIIGVWVGNIDWSPMWDNISGVSGGGPIWHTIAEYMIGRWLIRDTKTKPPLGITETHICLDTDCLRKERTYMKNPETIKSRPLDTVYYEEDFVWVITEEEKVRWNIK